MRATLLIALCAVYATQAAYFRLLDKTPLCFAEEVGYGSEVVIAEWYKRRTSANGGFTVTVQVSSPVSRSIVYSGTLRDAQGTFSFKPTLGEIGEYDVCLTAENMGGSGNPYVEIGLALDHHDRKVHVKADPTVTRQKSHGMEVFSFIDEDNQPKDTLRSHEYLSRINTELNLVKGTIEEIKSEIKYFRSRQDRLRSTSESTFDRVWGFSVVTIAVVSVVSWIQFAYLKLFLRKKKLV